MDEVLQQCFYHPIWLCRYHSIHHTDMKTNFCLFMPLYDILGKTINIRSWDLQKEIRSRTSESLILCDRVIQTFSPFLRPSASKDSHTNFFLCLSLYFDYNFQVAFTVSS